MNFPEAVSFLFGLRRYPPQPGIETTRDLLAFLGDPQEGVTFVQIAGSNGKGSTACMTERVLRDTGLSVGLYTSPHVESVRERVQVNGRQVPRKSVVAFVEAIREYVIERAAEGDPPTFFEALTALACFEFGRRDVDVAVLEVGIGGRYDATSVVSPTASAVTSVALEHTDFLGDTVEEIAADKAQVAPEATPLVTAATGEARAAIAAEVGGEGEILVVGNGEDSAADVRVSYEGPEGIEGRVSLAGEGWDIETPLGSLGAHQARNAGVAAALAREVGIELDVQVDENTLARGLRRAHWPGRFEVMGRDPLVVLDGAHNPGACAALSETLAEFDYEDLYLVFGAMQDKDYREMSSTLPRPNRVLTARPATDRAEDSTVLATVFERAGVGRVESTESVAAALETALAESGPEDCVLVAGSLYTVAEARPRWTRRPTPKRVADRADAEDLLGRAGVAEVERERVAEDLPHHTVEIRADGREARALRETMDRLDGVCAIAAIDAADRERRDIVLAGTHDQFLGLLGAIESGTHPALGGDLARDLRAAIDGADAVSSGPIGSAVSDTEATANDHRGPTESGDGDSSSNPSAYPWSDRTAVMGILNTTPDSFHDGGRYEALEDAVARAETMVAAGADIVDVGGESTRPGADPVPVEEEIERVRPVIERVSELDALVSIDTRKAAVARAALDAGADVLNDVSGLEDPEMRFVAAEHEVPIILMHSIDAPVVPGKDVEYDDVVADAIAELGERVRLAEQAGVPREDIVVDPGIGFGKRSAESFELLGRIEEFHALGCPVLAGHSRKSMFDLVGRSGAGTADQGLAATVAGSAVAAERGADIVRVHDVAENVAAVRVAEAASDPERFVDRE